MIHACRQDLVQTIDTIARYDVLLWVALAMNRCESTSMFHEETDNKVRNEKVEIDETVVCNNSTRNAKPNSFTFPIQRLPSHALVRSH